MKKFLIAALLGLTLGFAGVLYFYEPYDDPYVVEEKHDTYYATCRIVSGSLFSTGVLLDTGFVLGCGHGIDRNEDWKLQKGESHVQLEFQQGFHVYVMKGTVIAMGNDYSVIMPAKPMKSKVKLSMDYLKIGEPVYTFGFPATNKIHLSKGVQSAEANWGYERASMAGYYGNSGGGVFNSNNESVGVLKMLRLEHDYIVGTASFITPTERGIRLVRANVTVHHNEIVQDWVEYQHSYVIHNMLEAKNMGWTVLTPPTPPNPYTDDMIQLFSQLFIIFAAVGILRKELFSR